MNLTLFFIVLAALLLLSFLTVIMYFFAVAFVKQNLGDVDDLDSPVNKPIESYKEAISAGMEYIKSKPFIWVETVSYDGLKLAARYFDNHSSKTIILFHGYRSSALRDFSCAVEMYTKMGFNILLCDQRSHGRSEGKLITFGVKESCDVKSWIEWLDFKFNPEKIVLGGMSMGATTVLLACCLDLPKKVKAVVADCGFTSPCDIIKKVAKDSFKINANFFIPILNVCCKIFGKFSIKEANTVDALKKSQIPVLFIHGKADGFVPCEMSERAFKAAPKNSRLLKVENANHGVSFLVDKTTVTNEISDFFENNL